MTGGQRRFHARLWMVLGPVLLVALIALVLLRPSRADGATPLFTTIEGYP